MKKVLVMMSSYNGEKYIEKQIDSILEQQNCYIDLIVRDDGSSDHTKKILEEYQNLNKLIWYSGKNLGPAKSFMDLLMNAPKNYDYYAFSDQDDIWKEDKISTATNKIDGALSPTIYCGNAELVNSKIESLDSLCYAFKPQFSLCGVLLGGGVQGATMVFNHSLAEMIWTRPVPDFITMHDYYISCVCLAIGGEIIYDERPYLLYRQHDNNVIGVKKNICSTLKNRVDLILNFNNLFDISTVSYNILTNYSKTILYNQRKLLVDIIGYKGTIKSRIHLAAKKGIGNGRFNLSIAIRLAVLLGKI